jgi:antimicrobial peptide system SdpA family protein
VDHTTHARTSERTTAVTAVVALAVVVVLLGGSIFFSLPSNVLSIRDGSAARRAAIGTLPQGWAFFTKPPSDSEAVVFALRDDRVVNINRPPQAKVENWWGLSRRQRAQGPEVAQLVHQATTWTPCADVSSALACVTGAAVDQRYERVSNRSPVASVCGRAFVVETEPVRWQFRDFYDDARRALQYSAIEVECQ